MLSKYFEKVEHYMRKINKFYDENKTNSNLKLFSLDYLKSNYFCACYALDKKFYRAKLIRELPSQKFLVEFLDYGNRETVHNDDIRIITNEFYLFKNMPPKAIPVVVTNESLKNVDIEESLYRNELINLKIVHVIQSTGIPTVELYKHISDTQLTVRIKSVLNTINLNSHSNTSSAQASPISNIKNEMIYTSNSNRTQSLAGQQPLLDINSNYSTQYINNKNLNNYNLNEIEEIDCKDFVNTDLPNNSIVYVSHFQSPSEFVINLESCKKEYEQLVKDMYEFYILKPSDYKVKLPKENSIYIFRSEDAKCKRVKFVSYLSDRRFLKIYDIDVGHYDAVDVENLYYSTKGFLKLKPLAIKEVTYDLKEEWSQKSKVFFFTLIKFKQLYKATITKFLLDSDTFIIELSDSNGALSERLINAELANTLD